MWKAGDILKLDSTFKVMWWDVSYSSFSLWHMKLALELLHRAIFFLSLKYADSFLSDGLTCLCWPSWSDWCGCMDYSYFSGALPWRTVSSLFVLSTSDCPQPSGSVSDLHPPHPPKPGQWGQSREGDGAKSSPEAQAQALQTATHQHLRVCRQPADPPNGGERGGGAPRGGTQGSGGRGGKRHWRHWNPQASERAERPNIGSTAAWVTQSIFAVLQREMTDSLMSTL